MINSEDTKKLGLEAFAFVTFARIAVSFRLGLALSIVLWVKKNIMIRFKGDVQEDGGGDVEVLESKQVMISLEYENEQTVFEGYAGDAIFSFSNKQYFRPRDSLLIRSKVVSAAPSSITLDKTNTFQIFFT